MIRILKILVFFVGFFEIQLTQLIFSKLYCMCVLINNWLASNYE